jgi:hypothetical protein
VKRWLLFLICLFFYNQSYGETEIEELKNILYGAVDPNPNIPSYLVWEYTSSKSEYNYTKLQFNLNSIVYFYYIKTYSDKSYIIMEGNGNYNVKNNIIKIIFETFTTSKSNEYGNIRDVLEEENLVVELEMKLYNEGMLIKQINGKKIFAEDNGKKILDFKKKWNFSLPQ